MERARKFLPFVVVAVAGLLPAVVYHWGRGSLGAPTFAGMQPMSRNWQMAQVVAGLYIKPLYMLICAALIFGMRKWQSPEAAALFWGLGAFLAGEIFCAVNFMIYQHASLVSEYLHSYGMVVGFGLAAYALLEALDARVLHINRGHCALNGLCQTCKRAAPLHCAARRTGMLTLALAGLLAFLPLSSLPSPKSYLVMLFGFPYSYARFDLYQWYETRALPVFALACFGAALLPLLSSKGDPIPARTKILFSAGIGALGFSLFRLTLASIFADALIWFEFWEEFTELMFISALGFALWQFGGLFQTAED